MSTDVYIDFISQELHPFHYSLNYDAWLSRLRVLEGTNTLHYKPVRIGQAGYLLADYNYQEWEDFEYAYDKVLVSEKLIEEVISEWEQLYYVAGSLLSPSYQTKGLEADARLFLITPFDMRSILGKHIGWYLNTRID